MIVTAQPFLNELDIMDVKFHELKGVVDCHVVVESYTTYTGLPKPTYFLNSRERFNGFPILHYIADLPKNAHSPWERERVMHEVVAKCVSRLGPEIVMWLDADEVPRRDSVERFKEMNVETAMLEMEQINFYFNRRCTWMKWPHPKIRKYRDGDKSERNNISFPIITDAGWHFQNFGTMYDLLTKLNSFSHAHDDSTANFRKGIISGDRPGLDPCEPYEDYPQYVKDNMGRFHEHFA